MEIRNVGNVEIYPLQSQMKTKETERKIEGVLAVLHRAGVHATIVML